SSLQLHADLEAGRTAESPELIRGAIERTLRDLEDRDFRTAWDARPARRPVLAALLAAGVLAAGAALAPDLAGLWFRRMVLLRDEPWPRETTIDLAVVDEDKYGVVHEDGRRIVNVPERTPLQVQATVRGKMPSAVELTVVPVDAPERAQTTAMGRPGGKGWFQHIFPPLTQSLRLHATGGDDDDEEPVLEIRVARAPRVQSFRIDLAPPPYTGVPARTTSDANLAAPEGTRVVMHFEANMPLEAFDLAFDKAGDVRLTPGQDGAYRHEFTLAQSDFYTYRLKGGNGIQSVEAPRYVLTAEPDQPPRVQVEMPWQNALVVTPDAVVPLRGTATDDFGVAGLEIRWAAGEEPLAQALPLRAEDALQPLGGRSVPFYRDLSLADFGGIKVGERARFKVLVEDNRVSAAQPEPHRQFGDYEYLLQVLTPPEVERELAQRQTRLRDRVRDITVLAEARLAETEELLRDAGGDGAAAGTFGPRLGQIETGLNRITAELGGAARQFMRVFEGYLYNRLDRGNLTEKLLAVLSEIYRGTAETDPFKIYGEALGRTRAQANEGELLGRLVVILDLFVRAAAERAPEATRFTAQAGLTARPEDRLELLRESRTRQQALIEDLRALEDKLEAWEDYLDVIQGLRDLIDLQKGVKGKAEKLTK
ncbi:MAG TPA: hypothetical protein VEI02_13980, partial [Planctomycetota bacterium]|nr:hypothetical protein [Planctomycetota bacterium]